MTRKELAEEVNLAYDKYFYAIQDLGTVNKIIPPSPRLVENDPKTAERAKALWAEFLTEQQSLNQDYSDAIEAKHAREKTL